MEPLSSGNTPKYTHGYQHDSALHPWLEHKQTASQAKLRMPALLAAQRLGLADRRCEELSSEADRLRDWLLNRPLNTEPAQVERIEQRITGLEDRLHAERVAVWKDLMPLLTVSRDAAIEELRSTWLSEYGRLLNGKPSVGGGGDEPG